MYYKVVVTKPKGNKISNGFALLKEAKKYARKYSWPNDRVQIIEENQDEINMLYDYIVEDWSKK